MLGVQAGGPIVDDGGEGGAGDAGVLGGVLEEAGAESGSFGGVNI